MSENPTTPTTPIPPADPTKESPAKRRRRRRWPWVVGGLFVGLILLVVLAPTIASTGIVRSMVVPKVSSAVAPNGKVEIDSWSLGWFSGQKIDGIRVLDDQNAVVAHLNVSTGASLLALARGNYDVGQTTVTGDFDVRIDPETGRVNLLHILGQDAKPGEAPAPTPGEPKNPAPAKPVELPELKGKVLVDLNGTISSTRSDSKAIPLTKVESAKVNLDLSNLENGIGIDGLIKASVDGKPTSIAVTGTADAVQNRMLLTDPDKIAANLNAKIDRLDLAIVNTVLSALGMTDQTVAGLMQGSLAIKLDPGGAATIASGDNLGIDNLVYTGDALKGDTLRLKRTDLVLNISRAAGGGEFVIKDTGVKSDVATLNVNGTVPQQVVQNLIEKKVPGANGSVKIETSVPDFARLASMLPNTIALKEGTTVTGGSLVSTTNLQINPDSVVVNQDAKLDAAGTADGKPIRLEPSTLRAGATLAMRDGQPIDINSVKALSIDLASPFATIKGEGVPEKIAFDGKIDATRAKANISQFVDLGDKDFGGIINFALNTQGLPTNTNAPLAAKLTFDTESLTYAQGGETLLQNEKFNGTIDLLFKQTADAKTITFKQLLIGTESGLLGVWTAGDSQWISFFNNGAIAGEAKIISRLRPDKFAAMFAKNVDPQYKLSRGVLDSTLELALDKDKNEYRINLQSDLNKLDVGSLLKNERLQLGVTMFVPNSLAASHTWYEVASNFVAVKGEADIKLTEATGKAIAPLDRVQKLSFDGQIPSFAKLHALASSFMGQSTDKATGEALLPLIINSGSAAFNGTAVRDASKQTTTLTLDVPSIQDVSMQRGENRFELAKPATVKLAASVTNDVAKTTELKEVIVSQLDAQLPGIGSITMAKPVSITNLGADQPDAQGQIAGNADLAALGKLFAVVNGTNSIPYSGKATFTQTIATTSGKASITGRADVADLAPTAKDAQPLPIRSVALTNDLSADFKAKALSIQSFNITAPDLGNKPLLAVSGSLLDWADKQTLKDVKATFDLQWLPLWNLVKPIVDPKDELAVVVAGDYRREWTAEGSLKDMSTLQVKGDAEFEKLQAAGLDLSEKGKVVIPVFVKNGLLRFATPDGKDVADITVNGGTLRLAGIQLDLRDMTLSAPKKLQLLRSVQINSILARQLGKYASVLFANSSKATGTLDVKILSMNALPIADLAHMNESQNARIAFSVHDLYLDGYVPQALETVADLGTNGLRAEINDASLNIANGKVTNDVTFTIVRLESERGKDGKPREVRQGLPLAALGNIDLATLKLVDTKLKLPTALIKSDELRKYLGETIIVPVTGFANSPQLKPEKILEEAVKQQLRDPGSILGGILKDRNKNATDDGKKSDLDKVGDIVGGLLGGKKGSDSADKPKSDDAPRDEPRSDKPRDEKPRDDNRRDDTPREKRKKDKP